LIGRSANHLARLLADHPDDAALVTELYWTILSRAPREEELRGVVAHLASSGNRRSAAEDITWALLNAKEFLLRQ
jgi:hypothetical protein